MSVCLLGLKNKDVYIYTASVSQGCVFAASVEISKADA